jgi:hypothetical protein
MKQRAPLPAPSAAFRRIGDGWNRRAAYDYSGVFMATCSFLPVNFPWPVRVLSEAELSMQSESDLDALYSTYATSKENVVVRFLFAPQTRVPHFFGDFSLEAVPADNLSPFPLHEFEACGLRAEKMENCSKAYISELKHSISSKTPISDHFGPAMRLARSLIRYER